MKEIVCFLEVMESHRWLNTLNYSKQKYEIEKLYPLKQLNIIAQMILR